MKLKIKNKKILQIFMKVNKVFFKIRIMRIKIKQQKKLKLKMIYIYQKINRLIYCLRMIFRIKTKKNKKDKNMKKKYKKQKVCR